MQKKNIEKFIDYNQLNDDKKFVPLLIMCGSKLDYVQYDGCVKMIVHQHFFA